MDDPVRQKGTEVVMHLIELCEDLAALAAGAPQKRGWEEIFMAVGEVCLATEEQITEDMSARNQVITISLLLNPFYPEFE